MRNRLVCVVGLAVGLSMSACSGGVDRESAASDVLVLEVGGRNPSLRASLVALGRWQEPAKLTPPEVDADFDGRSGLDPIGDEQPVLDRSGGGEVADAPPSPETDEPMSKWVEVPLPEGETLMHVARRHLGDGRRYLELLEWNGWTEADAPRLRAGQAVKIMRSEMR